MNEHRDTVRDRSALLGPRARMLFSLACAERLSACCWAYEQTSKAPMGVFYLWLHGLFGDSIDDKVMMESLPKAKRELELVVPVSDDGSSPLTVQAQSAALCLLDAVESRERLDSCVASSDNTIDAVDNYFACVTHELTGGYDVADSYPLLEREKDRQLRDIDFLALSTNMQSSSLASWRIENRQFLVPVALKYSATAKGRK